MTNTRFNNPRAYFGVPLYGATLDFFLSGTNTRQDTFSDAALTTANTNPVEADTAGRFGEIFLSDGVAYKVVLKDQAGATIWTADPVESGTSFTIDGSNQFTEILNVLYHQIKPETISSASYTVLNTDWGALKYFTNSSTITVTLPSPTVSTFINGWYCYIKNNGGSALTINATATIDGATSLVLQPGNAALIVSNGATYYTNSNQGNNIVAPAGGSALTISSGAITTGNLSSYRVDTEGAASTDDLVTINGVSDGKVLILRTVNDARDVVIKHNTGNIFNPAAQDITLGKTQDSVTLRYDSNLSRWIVLAYENSSTRISSIYRSAAQTLTAGTELTLAHSLGQIPDVVQIQAVCTTSDIGYSVGERITLPAGVASATSSPSVNTGFATKLDATNVKVRVAPDGVTIPRGDNADPTNMTLSSWDFYINAFYY